MLLIGLLVAGTLLRVPMLIIINANNPVTLNWCSIKLLIVRAKVSKNNLSALVDPRGILGTFCYHHYEGGCISFGAGPVLGVFLL
jgi:hypothetical protein